MRFEFKPSFDRSLRSLPHEEKEEVKKETLHAIDVLSQDRPLSHGLGLKRLRGDYWEFRVGIRTRAIFRWDKDLVEFILVGNHDQIKRYLKGI
jgi:mRNA-degrading endonuclease RelE of RelBE toxin-antitoxin system